MAITVRHEKHGSHKTFEETLYIMEDCKPDVIVRRDISKKSLQSKDGNYPTHYKAEQRQEVSQAAAVANEPPSLT
jgi:hypothetical protein